MLYTSFIDLDLFSRTTKADVRMLVGSVDGCTNTTHRLVYTLFDDTVRLYRGGEGCEWKSARHDRPQALLDLRVAVDLTAQAAER